MVPLIKVRRFLSFLAAISLSPAAIWADEPVRIQERFVSGDLCRVSCRVEVTGTLTPEPEKGKASTPLPVKGESAIEYDERVQVVDSSGIVQKTVRIYRRIDFQRKVGDHDQSQTIRPAVRRLVLLRKDNAEVPFSPDGPLMWGEIDLVRTDVFIPALAGLLPAEPVRIGDRWAAAVSAVKELTDMERIEDGRIECKLEEVAALSPSGQTRRQARIAFSGTVRGVNEDGPNRQQLDGYFYFDLESAHLSYLTLKGVHVLLDKDGKEVGKVEGRFTLTRQTSMRSKDLSDDALKGVMLEPNADNTLLLYDNPDLGVRFLYPRRWRLAAERGVQIGLDAADGSGLMLTVESATNVPTAAQYLKEARDWLTKQKVKIVRQESAKTIRGENGQLERFALEAEANGQKMLMDYIIIRQQARGGTIAARLLPNDLAALRAEVERIARSVVISKQK
jgi:hypothetical protein